MPASSDIVWWPPTAAQRMGYSLAAAAPFALHPDNFAAYCDQIAEHALAVVTRNAFGYTDGSAVKVGVTYAATEIDPAMDGADPHTWDWKAIGQRMSSKDYAKGRAALIALACFTQPAVPRELVAFGFTARQLALHVEGHVDERLRALVADTPMTIMGSDSGGGGATGQRMQMPAVLYVATNNEVVLQRKQWDADRIAARESFGNLMSNILVVVEQVRAEKPAALVTAYEHAAEDALAKLVVTAAATARDTLRAFHTRATHRSKYTKFGKTLDDIAVEMDMSDAARLLTRTWGSDRYRTAKTAFRSAAAWAIERGDAPPRSNPFYNQKRDDLDEQLLKKVLPSLVI